MTLSNNIISKFAKLTNDKNKKNETVVYGTTVSQGDKLFVNIDGSDTITPVVSTSEIQAGERVTVLIKDHVATITGNITNPSASTESVGKVLDEYDTIVAKIGDFELIVADKVTTEELEAELAIIDEALIEKATIGELEAVKATIEDLDVSNLEAELAEIELAIINKAEITDLDAAFADIDILEATVADIETLVGGNLTMDNIQSLVLTASKVTVDNAFIKDAMIDRVSASKLSAGTINTNFVKIESEDGSMVLDGSVQQFKDDSGNVRIQIGKDASGNFTFVLYDSDGEGILIDEGGIKSSDAIGDGLIVDVKVAEGANISGSKLDISSVITEINADNSTTIKSNKIYLDEQNQSLEVAFNSLKTQVETINDVTVDGDLSSVIEQIQSNTTNIEVNKASINTLISEDILIKKEVSDLEGTVLEVNDEFTNKFTDLEQNLEGFKTTVNQTYATKSSVTDLSTNLTTNYSTTEAMQSSINQKVNEISTSISETYATKETVEDLNTNLTTNYSTTAAMNSAINQSAQSITTSVSATYATKDELSDEVSELENSISTVEQSASKINWIVKSGTNASDMVLTDEMYSVVASKIDLTGYVTFNDLSTTGKTTINGSNIVTGIIDADLIDVINLNADNITSGTISAELISGGTIKGVTLQTYADTTSKGVVIGKEMLSFNGTIFKYETADEFRLVSDQRLSLASVDEVYLMPGLQSDGTLSNTGSVVIPNATLRTQRLTVVDDGNVEGDFSVTGVTSVGLNLSVGGQVTCGNIEATSVKGINGFTSNNGGISVTGDIITTGGSINAKGGAIGGNLSVTGTSYLSAISATTITASGNINTTGSIGATNGISSSGSITGMGSIKLENASLYSPVGTASRDYLRLSNQIISADGTNGIICTTATGAWTTLRAGAIYSDGTFLSSDRRLKTDIQYLDTARNVKIGLQDMHNFIENLPMASYRFISEVENNTDTVRYGFIAQDILSDKAGNELIETDVILDEDGNVKDERLRYSMDKFVAFICGALKEEIRQRKLLEEKMNRLENDI